MMKKSSQEHIIKNGLLIVSLISVMLVILLVIFIINESVPVFQEYGFLKFILTYEWMPENNEFGILPMILGSVYITSIALLIAVPLSVSCAIFLEEIAPKHIKNIFGPVIETLAGIPSVIYGFFGLAAVAPVIRELFGGSGLGIISASIILSIMILPTIISLTQDAIQTVPEHCKEASVGLGATQWQTIKNITLPIALPGIITAVILGLGRAVGETLAVLMLAGNVSQIPGSLFDPVRTLTSNIALEMGYATGMHYSALFATAVILFIVIVILMIVSNYIQHKYTVKETLN